MHKMKIIHWRMGMKVYSEYLMATFIKIWVKFLGSCSDPRKESHDKFCTDRW